MKQVIDMATWPRRHNFEFFKTFVNPFITITSEVDCTEVRQKYYENGGSFFLRYLYAILKAVNEMEEFRYRIDLQDRLVLFDKIDALAIVSTGEEASFKVVRIPFIRNYEIFCEKAAILIGQNADGENPFAEENEALENENLDVVMVSAMPFLSFTSITPAQENKYGSSFPLFTVGKITGREGRLMMPVAVSANHAFVDGYHVARLMDLITGELNRMS